MNEGHEIIPNFQPESMIPVSFRVIKRYLNKRPPSTFFNAGHKKPAVKELILKN